jgi:Ca2+-binding EF-hand superfamily protein
MPPGTAKPLDLRADFDAKDKSKNGKLSRKESGLSIAAFKQADTDGDGRVSRREFRGAFEKANAFTTLDRDGDKKLSAEEMQKLQRFTQESYDANQDGHVDETEFDQARIKELRAGRIALRMQEYTQLTAGDKQKLKAFDTDKDGQISQEEYFAGRGQEWRARRETRIMGIFSKLAGSESTLETAKAGSYAKYDRDQDGKITRAEFQAGQIASYRESYRERGLYGEVKTEALRNELGIDRHGASPAPASRPKIEEPAREERPREPITVGNLKNLTHAQALELVEAQGGVPPRPGSPTVLAVRTESANSRGWEDHFVVLKADGDMKTFAATTRPSYTSSKGVGMLLPGNYRLTPRWKDHKWRNAFIVNTQNGSMNVRVARDHNGDGRYTGKERTNPGSSVNIRLHPGVNGAPSSAGCLNVKDYDAFIRYMGGTEVSFHMTLVET